MASGVETATATSGKNSSSSPAEIDVGKTGGDFLQGFLPGAQNTDMTQTERR